MMMKTREMPSGPEMDAMRLYCDQVPAPDPAELTTLRRATLARLVAEPVTRSGVRRRGLLLTAATGLLAAVALSTVAMWPATTDRPARGDGVPAGLDGPAMLRLVADRAGSAEPVTVNEHEYVYTNCRTVRLTKAPAGDKPGVLAWFTATQTIETWASTHGLTSARTVITTGIDAHPLTAADAARLRGSTYPGLTPHRYSYPAAAGSRPLPEIDPKGSAGSKTPSLLYPTPEYLNSLPTDPSALLAVIHRQLPPLTAPKPGGSSDTQASQDASAVFQAVSTVMSRADALLSPDLRAALYRVLASLPGISRVPGQQDLAGRTGIAVSITVDGVRYELILDPNTSRVIGTRGVLTVAQAYPGGVLAAGTVTEWSTTQTRIVAGVNATS
jgi:hypothetical protein